MSIFQTIFTDISLDVISFRNCRANFLGLYWAQNIFPTRMKRTMPIEPPTEMRKTTHHSGGASALDPAPVERYSFRTPPITIRMSVDDQLTVKSESGRKMAARMARYSMLVLVWVAYL